MSEPCITCGGDVGPPIPALVEAKRRLGLPLTPAKRCPKCVWQSLLKLAEDDGTSAEARKDGES